MEAIRAAPPSYAFATPLRQVYVDEGTFRIASEADLSGYDVQLIGAGGIIVPSLGPGGGSVIKSTSGILELIGVDFDGGSDQPKDATATTWIIFVGNPQSYMRRVRIDGCTFRNCTASDGTLRVNGAKVTHVIYARGVAQLDLLRNTVENCSGAAVFLNNVAEFNSLGNRWIGTDWYTFNIASGSTGIIDGDTFNSNKPTGVYWGGAINTVNAQGRIPNKNIVVRNCIFSGHYSYGAVVRLQSDNGITCERNTFLNCDRGSLAHAGGGLSAIRVSTWNPRGLRSSVSAQNVEIRNNRALLGLGAGSYRAFIYVDNVAETVARNFKITGNVCRSPDAANYFTAGILVNGRRSGFDEVSILDNDCELYMTTVSPLAGGIAIAAADVRGLVDHVTLGGNRVKNLHRRTGAPQTCYQIGPYVDNVHIIRANRASGGYYGLRTVRETDRTILGIRDQVFDDCIVSTLLT